MTHGTVFHTRRGFTLLEVLISVVVLAFGLLGVVAVFPAVIDLQRRAQDAVIGGASAASAEAVFRATLLDSESLDWAEDFEEEDVPKAQRYPVSWVLTNDIYLGTVGIDRNTQTMEVDFLWEVDWDWNRSNDDALRGALLDEGLLVLGNGLSTERGLTTMPAPATVALNGLLPAVQFTVADRLLPDAGSEASPRYIWDAVVRRVDTGIGSPRSDSYVARDVPVSRMSTLPVEIAIFVRPIDRGVRVPPGLTLRDVLSGFRIDDTGDIIELDDDQRSFPVTVRSNDLVTRQLGARIGPDVKYSPPISMRVLDQRRFGADGAADGGTTTAVLDLQRLIPEPNEWPGGGNRNEQVAGMRAALAQVGQLFVDNLGVVHRVTRVTDNGLIEIDPPLSDPGYRAGRVSQIVFTPQVPADIRVIRTR